MATVTRNPVGWFEIYVSDLGRARNFYEAVFDVKLQKLDSPDPTLEMWSFPSTQEGNGAPGALAKMENGPTGGGGTIVYFSCEDCATEAARVSSNGGTVMKGKFPIGPYGFIALVVDTEKNVIGLHSMK